MVSSHDWSTAVDGRHLRAIRTAAPRFSRGGIPHLVLEVVAYAVDEALHGTTSRIWVTVHGDRSISVGDDGRGTQVRYDETGRATVKPIMSTRDLRFFEVEGAPVLPDGHPRCGISVVSALSTWLTHTNRRDGRGWRQRYEHGLPVGSLVEVPGGEESGTTVRFRPDPAVFGADDVSAVSLRAACAPFASTVDLDVIDEHPATSSGNPWEDTSTSGTR